MDKFSRGEELGPFPGVVGAKDLKIGLNLLIGSFSLSVYFGMIGSVEAAIIFKDASKFTSEGRGELWAFSIIDDGVMQSKVFEYISWKRVEQLHWHQSSLNKGLELPPL